MPSKDIALMAHLMRRAGFGASYEELEARAAKGYEATVEELLDPEAHGIPGVDLHMFNRYHPLAEAEASTEKSSLTFMYYLLTTQRPLEEKMTLLWHMIFATGNSKVENSRELTGQLDTFRKYGMGSYRELLVKLSKEPRDDLLAGQQREPQDRRQRKLGPGAAGALLHGPGQLHGGRRSGSLPRLHRLDHQAQAA